MYYAGDSYFDSELTTIELTPSVDFFGDNSDPIVGNEIEQKALFQFEGHITRNLSSAIWVSFDATYVDGGTLKIDGVARQSESRALGGPEIEFNKASGSRRATATSSTTTTSDPTTCAAFDHVQLLRRARIGCALSQITWRRFASRLRFFSASESEQKSIVRLQIILAPLRGARLDFFSAPVPRRAWSRSAKSRPTSCAAATTPRVRSSSSACAACGA